MPSDTLAPEVKPGKAPLADPESSEMDGDKGNHWSPEALEKAGSGLKALNRMAKRPPVHINFEDISYTVSVGRGERRILNNISGEFRSGELACILGPSGAGKSTLLNILAGYTSNGLNGRITVNGHARDLRVFKKLSSYIMQDDMLQPRLSVQEAMRIAADLKLGSELGKAEKELIVKEILQTLGLWDHMSTMTEKLSGGQLKRLSIALELVSNPPIIFLDEPTTGLDVISIRQLVVLLRMLSRQGRTIICTIHQPPASLFALFDRTYVLAHGLCCYQGVPDMLVPHMAQAGYICPTTHNPADYIIETLQLQTNSNKKMSEISCNGKHCARKQSYIGEDLDLRNSLAISNEAAQRVFVDHISKDNTYKMEFPCSFWTQFSILIKRMFVQSSRNSIALWIQCVHHIGSALLVGGIFYQIGNNASIPVTNFKFCLCCLVFFLYTYIMTPVLLFPLQVEILRREYFNRWYSLKAYYLALTLSTMPLMIVLGSIFSAICFVMSGQSLEWNRFLLFALNGLVLAFCSEGFGLAIGATFRVTDGCIMAPSISSPLLVLACYGMGFGSKIETIMRALMRMSYMRYGAVGFTLALFQDREKLDCPEDMCFYEKPEMIIRDIGMAGDTYWFQIVGLLVFTFLHRLFFYLSLRYNLTVEFSNKFMNYISKYLKHR